MDEGARGGLRTATVQVTEPMPAERAAADGAIRRATTVMVIDDHQMLAESLAIALDLHDDLQCVGIAGTVTEALHALARSEPDVVLMDLGLPDVDGIEGTRLVRARHPRCRVLAFTGSASVQALVDVAEAGAAGFLPKHVPLARLAGAIRGDPASETVPGRVLDDVLATSKDRRLDPREAAAAGGLTEREHTVIMDLAEGIEVKQIARRLDITVNTCRDHVRSVRRKFGVHTQLAAVVRAAHEGMLPNLRARMVTDTAPRLPQDHVA